MTGRRECRTMDVGEVHPAQGAQIRQRFGERALEPLVESMRRHAVLEPILVRELSAGDKLVAGERRWRATKLAGVARISAVVQYFRLQRIHVAAEAVKARLRHGWLELRAAIELLRIHEKLVNENAKTEGIKLEKMLERTEDWPASRLERLARGMAQGGLPPPWRPPAPAVLTVRTNGPTVNPAFAASRTRGRVETPFDHLVKTPTVKHRLAPGPS